MQPTPNTGFDAAVSRLEAAITSPDGTLRAIDRIEFEVCGETVRWTLWQDGRRLYMAPGRADDLDGFLAATKMILSMRAETEGKHHAPTA